MASKDRVPRDCELLIPVADSGGEDASSKPSSSSSSSHHTGHECVLFPIAITFYIAWWFIYFVDSFFSPIHAQLGINIFGKSGEGD
nr:protein CONTINUOUS VASCULAR RING 1-like [Malus domestica]